MNTFAFIVATAILSMEYFAVAVYEDGVDVGI
jgi:hypothetical protein